MQVEVADPYIELRTGPGRGYPIFYVAERGEKVEILKRRTDWFKVRTARQREGWVDRAQMERTLIEAGVQRSFRDVLLEEHLQQRFEVGFAAGRFEEDAVTKMRAGWRAHRHFQIELSIGQVSGDFASSEQFDVNVLAYPFPQWRAQPFFTIGVGRFESKPKGTIVQALKTEDTAPNAGVGVHVKLGRKLGFRADWRSYVVLVGDDRNERFTELTVGLSFLF